MRLLAKVSGLLILFALFFCSALAQEAPEITSYAEITVSRTKSKIPDMLDGNYRTYWADEKPKAYVCFELPEDMPCYGLYLNFRHSATDRQYEVQTMADGEWKAVFSPEYYLDNQYIPLQGVTKIRVYAPSDGLGISMVRLLGEGDLPGDICLFEPTCEKADLMLIVTHPDDELLWFGGLLPYYGGELGLNVQVVYLTYSRSYRVNELLDGLYTCGIKNAPVIIGWEDKRTDKDITKAFNRWGGRNKVFSTLVDLIRVYRPEVVVTQDVNGEYGHIQHRAMVSAVKRAVPLACDETYKDSSLPAWQVKKVYLHLYKENAIRMDWRKNLEKFGGETALSVASRAFDCHKSQSHARYQVVDEGPYDSSLFGLYYSVVGEDVLGGDFFENIELNNEEAGRI